ncbi:C40 family peptidase [Peptacetobacter sp.]|uniref:C40 family peptidase n=1 Tax=Peptacetobacter sp. TaxID=2991975 RepID=UPI00262F3D8C|nr:C40 family peptidase [Peptacetobacter sp.]
MKKAIATLGISAATLIVSSTDTSAQETAKVIAEALNMRTGPGINYSKRGTIQKDSTVTILEKSKGWVKIKTSSGKIAWVSGQYLKASSNIEESDSSYSNTESGYMAYVSVSSSLNVRSSASTSSSVITSLKNNTRVQVIEKSNNGWTKIKTDNGQIGWVSSKYIVSSPSSGNTSSQEESEIISGNLKINVSSGLNVRKGPGTNYSVIGSLSGGSIVKAKEKSNGWYKIETANGVEGWISGKYVSSTNESGNSQDTSQNNSSSTVSGRVKVTISKGLNIRTGPGTNNSILGSLSGGSVVEVKEKSNGWYKIETANGVKGWISGDYVTSTNEPLTGSTSSNSNNQGNNTDTSYGNGETSATGDKIVDYAYTLLGVPYKWGGNGPSSFDCSGYTQWVYRNAAGISIPRVSRDQAQSGSPVSRGDYKKGDLLYFDTSGNGSVSHVGIYIGGDKFIHCSGTQSKPGCVKVSSLSGFYANALLGARRFV